VPRASGPGPVAVLHRVTIVTALLGAIAYTAWAATQGSALGVVAGLAVSAGIWAYLRNLRARLDAKLTPGRHA
jgi:ABC-type nitrate/sulfonate/bicarbonate transport system permease component